MKESNGIKNGNKYLHNIGDIVNGLEILSYTRHGKKNEKAYFTRCIKDGYENPKPITESHLKRGDSCSVCSNQVIVKGINDLHTTANWMCQYIVNEEDWYRYAKQSNKKVTVKCPHCGQEKYMIICNLYNRGFSCSCGDGNSYPNKFVVALLNQLNIDYEVEKTFSWSENRRYDIYIPSLNCIIENHGEQHYITSRRGRSLQEEQTNDLMKEILAKGNGVRYYIELDCRESSLEWIKDSVMQSDLPKLLGFKEDDVNWNKCEEFALSNLVKQVCDYRRETNKTANEIAKEFKLGLSTVILYLKRGVKLGWCEYDAKKEQLKAVSKNGKKSGKMIEVFKDGVSFGVFQSARELEKQSKELFGTRLFNSYISDVANGKQQTYNGYIFKFVELEKK